MSAVGRLVINFKHYSLARHYIVMSTHSVEPGSVTPDPTAGGPTDPAHQRLVDLFDLLAPKPGVTRSSFEGVNLMRVNSPMPRMPVMYEPSIVIVCQGRKRGYLGDQVFTYDAHNYLVLSVPLPFECETEASPEIPMLAVQIRVDLVVLAELLMKMDGTHRSGTPATPQGIYST